MSVIGRLIPSLESQVNLNNFRGVSTPDALYRMSGVRITGLLGSMTSVYGFAIDIFEDIQKEIDKINEKLDIVRKYANKLMRSQLEKEKIIIKEKEEKENKEKEKRERTKNLNASQNSNNGNDAATKEEGVSTNNCTISEDDDITKEIEKIDQFMDDIQRIEAIQNFHPRKIGHMNYHNNNNNEENKTKKDRAYEFAYECQYSKFQEECLINILEQRAKKFGSFAPSNNSFSSISDQSLQIINDDDKSNASTIINFTSTPIYDNDIYFK